MPECRWRGFRHDEGWGGSGILICYAWSRLAVDCKTNPQDVIAGLDPAIHRGCESRSWMDPRVKPKGDKGGANGVRQIAETEQFILSQTL